MKELFTALQTRYDGSSGTALKALAPTMVVGRANQNTTGEYITLSQPAGTTDHTIGMSLGTSIGSQQENIQITFNVWTDNRSPQAGWKVVNAVKALYDNQILSLSSSYEMLHALRQSPGIQIEEPDGKGWHIPVEYEYRIGRKI